MEYKKEKILERIKKLPFSIPVLVTLISICGFILLYSAASGNIEPWAIKQIITFCIFMPISLLIAIIDLRFIYNFSYIFYIFTLILLIIVTFAGKFSMGATRWIDLGVFTIQPSELSKIAIILMLAKYFHDEKKYHFASYVIIFPIIASVIPIVLIIKQPDLGTAIVSIIVVTSIFFAIGTRFVYFIISGTFIIILMPVIWSMMHNYQRSRVLTFLYPERDPLGAGYNIIQSKIAIGSGGLVGKGLLSGSQSQLKFLPEHQTDFIFSFLTEELGFIGGITLLILYLMLILCSLSVAINTRSQFGQIMVIGISTLFFSHIFINIAMVMGLLPIVGIPLPLISYGRTMIVSMLIGFGLIMNVSVNRFNNI